MNLRRMTTDGLEARQRLLRADARELTEILYSDCEGYDAREEAREELDLIYHDLASIAAELALRKSGSWQEALPWEGPELAS